MLKIVTEPERALASHAQRQLREAWRNDERHVASHNIIPRGVPIHATRYPIFCDDCGNTYWSRDPFADHVGCPGAGKVRAGF